MGHSPADGAFILGAHSLLPLDPGATFSLGTVSRCNKQPAYVIHCSNPKHCCCHHQAPAASSGSGSQARGASGGVDSLPGHLRDLKLTGDRRESKDQVGRSGSRV
jgi:hypothetical protein